MGVGTGSQLVSTNCVPVPTSSGGVHHLTSGRKTLGCRRGAVVGVEFRAEQEQGLESPDTGLSGNGRSATARPSFADAARRAGSAGIGTLGQSCRNAASFSFRYAGDQSTAMR